MKLILIEKQIDLIMKSLEEYSKISDEKNLIYATYESIQEQKISAKQVISGKSQCNQNVI